MNAPRDSSDWNGVDRRAPPARRGEPTPSQIMDAVLSLDAKFEAMMRSAFPDGDPVAHRLGHEAQTKRDDDASEDRRVMRRDLVKGSLWGAIVIGSGLVLTGALDRLAKFLGKAP